MVKHETFKLYSCTDLLDWKSSCDLGLTSQASVTGTRPHHHWDLS
jgi:hypothetical protein